MATTHKDIVASDGESYRLNIWDTGGNKKYRSLSQMMYDQIEGVMIAFDTTNKETFKQFLKVKLFNIFWKIEWL